MKQKKIGDILYVYSTTAYEITEDTDATVIKIQEECIPAYAALNSTLVSKFSPINYKLFCVKHPEWADYMNDYTVDISTSITGGTVTASPTSGDEGEEITLTHEASTGYEFAAWLVSSAASVEVEVTDNKFLMPASNVSVYAQFDKIDFDITVDDQIQNGSLSAPATANLGDTVTITATPASGYTLDTLTVMCGSLEISVVNNQFTMPAGDVTVTGTFKQAVVPYNQRYFTIESLEDGNVLSIGADAGTSGSRYYSTDGGTTWNSFGPMASFNLDTGDKIMFKNTGDDFALASEGSFTDPLFGTTKTFNVYGNIMSLLYGDNFANQTSLPLPSTPEVYGNFMGLFFGSKVVDASNLILPATTLQEKCYNYMFCQCTSLTTAPSLPATTLAQNCYTSMFFGCSSLTTAPILPATTLTNYCYDEMFSECTSLRSITMLATTLGDLSTNSALYNIVYNTYTDDTPSEQRNGKMYVSSSLSAQQKSDIHDQLVATTSYDYWTVADYVPAS